MYIATAEYDARVTQSDIAAVANRTELTIRNWYQEQEVVLRETEPVPSDAHSAIDYVAERTAVGTDVCTIAHKLPDRAVGIDTEEEPLLWALPATLRTGHRTPPR